MTSVERHAFFWALLPIAACLGLWELIARLWVDNASLLPPVSAVMQELAAMIASGELWHHLKKSLLRVVAGFCTGSLAGFLLGTLLGWKKYVHRMMHPLVSLLYPIPALGWLPIFMLWFGIGELLPIAVIFMCSFFPVVYATESGIRSVDLKMIRAARSLGASEHVILATVLLPLSLPAIFTGLRLEAGMAWRVIIAAEMIAIPTGIGALLMRAESLIRMDIVIVCLLALSGMCFCFERFFLLLEQRITGKW